MSLEIKLNEYIKQAMLAKNKELLDTLRAIKSALLLAKSEKEIDGAVNEDIEIKILQKLVKQRRETLEIYFSQNRKNKAHIEKVPAYLHRNVTFNDAIPSSESEMFSLSLNSEDNNQPVIKESVFT